MSQQAKSPSVRSNRRDQPDLLSLWGAAAAVCAAATALAATIYATVTANRTAAGKAAAEALSAGLALASWVMAAFSFVGVLMALGIACHRAAKGTVHDSAAAAAAHTHTLPTSATLIVARVSRED